MLQAGEASAAPSLAAAALDKLKQVHELIMHAGDARQTRLAYQLGALMAREQLVAQDPASARRLLQSVAGSALPLTASQESSQQTDRCCAVSRWTCGPPVLHPCMEPSVRVKWMLSIEPMHGCIGASVN